MTEKIVNLRQARKRKARADAAKQADANAAQHGLTAGQKTLAELRIEKAKRDLEGHERE